MNKRDERALKTKEKIINAAKELIKENGIDNVSVDDITKKAGVAKGSYYVYFSKKEDIISEIGCLEFRYINEEINEMNEDNILKKLQYYFKRYKDGLMELGVEISKCWLQNNLNCRCKLEYDFNAINKLLEESKNEFKEDANLNDLTYKIIAILYGISLIWIMSDGRIEDRTSNQIGDLLLPYLEVVNNG